MARTISDEELQLKKRARRRLVGAIVLATAAAVILPMVLDSEPRPVSQNVNIQIPSPDSGEYKPKAAPPSVARSDKADKAATTSEVSAKGDATVTTVTSPPADMTRLDEPKAASTDTPKASRTDSAKAAAKTDTSKTPARDAASAGGSFVVQVAALADADKAQQLEKRMADTGLKTYTEVVTTQAGDVTRVRAGPYPTREAAEKARAQLKKAGLDGKVVAK